MGFARRQVSPLYRLALRTPRGTPHANDLGHLQRIRP